MLTEQTLTIIIKVNNLLAFIGGCIGAFTHFLSKYTVAFSNLNYTELLDFTMRSVIGGVVMLAFKLIGEWLVHKIQKSRKDKGNE